MSNIGLRSLIGRGYDDFWRFKGRYRVVKGSRASKKSKTMALNLIYNIMKYPDANALVVRKTFRTLQNSCYSDLVWAIGRFKAEKKWHCTKSPLGLTYLPTGQQVLFRGLDDPLKVTSISVPKGILCFLWIEEAYEITSEEAFNRLDESIRGQMPKGLYPQITLTLNPWSDRHWIKKRFFDEPNDYTLAKTTNYLCNEFLGEADYILFEEMKKNPKRYRVAGLGEWGVVDGLIYDNWREEKFDLNAIRRIPNIKSRFGLDFGYTIDPTALFCGLVDTDNRRIFIFDELYERGLTNKMIYERIYNLGYAKERIRADSSEPKSITELREYGLRRIEAAKKGPDSVNYGIQNIRNYEIIVHPRCVNTITELSLYAWEKDRFEQYTGRPEDANNHLMDAMRYGLEDLVDPTLFTF